MDMDSVIGRQRISPRRKPAPLIPPVPQVRNRPSPAPRARGPFAFLHGRAVRPPVPKPAPGTPPAKLAAGTDSRRSRAPWRNAAIAASGFLAVLLAFGAAGGVSARHRFPARMNLHEDPSSQEILSRFVSPELGDPAVSEGGIDMPPLPVTLAVSTYVVRPGDALSSIASRYRISLDTLISMNGIRDARRIQAGTRLRVPNISGIVHVVARGESVGSVAARYGVGTTAILDANDLGSSVIRPGQSLFIPGARMSATELKKALGELVAWPVRGGISSGFGYRPNPFTGIRQFHNAIDIVAPEGTPVRAAMDGRVADTGYNAIYGNYVILTHPDGYQTLYAHLSKVAVKRGASLRQGAALGAVGSTGYSTGPHLHFSVFKRGSAVDPLKLLK